MSCNPKRGIGKLVAGRDDLKSLRTGEGILTISLFFPVVFQWVETLASAGFSKWIKAQF